MKEPLTDKHENNCTCVYCKNKKGFSMPTEIIEAAKNGDLVIFAGAGVSTETKLVFNKTLYEEIRVELGIERDKNLNFSSLMSLYCSKPNGRKRLLKKIKSRFDYINSFPELYRTSSRFHRELSTIYQIKEIITTNWDDLFENECGAVPIVIPEDFAFWDLPDRKVFKIHGSINNLSTIVATEEDYQKCLENLNTGLIGSSLKLLLATKLVVFIGYSFGDEDFNQIYDLLKNELKNLLPHSYIVTIDETSVEKYQQLNLTPIVTDGTHFISLLKQELIESNQMLDDSRFEEILPILFEVTEEHESLTSNYNIKDNPEIFFTLNYQDGLIHAFERILARKKTGDYSHICKIISAIDTYEKMRKEKLTSKIYHDVAYIDGYLNALKFLLLDDEEREGLPLYYLFGSKKDIITFDDYCEQLKDARTLHKGAYKYAQKIVEKLGDTGVIHHTPFL